MAKFLLQFSQKIMAAQPQGQGSTGAPDIELAKHHPGDDRAFVRIKQMPELELGDAELLPDESDKYAAHVGECGVKLFIDDKHRARSRALAHLASMFILQGKFSARPLEQKMQSVDASFRTVPDLATFWSASPITAFFSTRVGKVWCVLLALIMSLGVGLGWRMQNLNRILGNAKPRGASTCSAVRGRHLFAAQFAMINLQIDPEYKNVDSIPIKLERFGATNDVNEDVATGYFQQVSACSVSCFEQNAPLANYSENLRLANHHVLQLAMPCEQTNTSYYAEVAGMTSSG